MKVVKNVWMTLLVVCLMCCLIPVGSLTADAAETENVYAETEPNNTIAAAEKLYNNYTYTGTLTEYDVDVYSLKLSDYSEVGVATAALYDTLTFGVFDSTGDACLVVGEDLGYDEDSSMYMDLVYAEFPAGQYYIVVMDEANVENGYAISAVYETTCAHKNLSAGEVYVAPTPEETGWMRYTCKDCGEDVYEEISTDHAVKIITQPKTAYAKSGATVKTTVKATGDGLTYTWYVKNAGASTYTKSSIKSATYSCAMDSTRKDRRVYCRITDKYGNTVQTKSVLLRMAATITKQPTNASAAVGSVAKTKVTAVGDELTYTWYLKNPGATKFSKSSVTSSTYSCKMSESNDGRQVYCIVTDKYGKTATSSTVTLTVPEPVEITTQPKTTYTKQGVVAKTTVKAAGDGLTYQWYVKNAGGTSYSKSSNTTATYSVKMTTTSKDRYVYCVIKDKYGNSVKSNTVRLRMAATITTQPKSVTVAEGKQAKVTLKAAGDGLTYTWYYKDAGSSKFYKTTSFTGTSYYVTMNAARDGRQIYCVVTDKYGKTAKTNTVTLDMQ